MSQTRYRFIQPVPAVVPVNVRVVAGDRVQEAISKLQGQIAAKRGY